MNESTKEHRQAIEAGRSAWPNHCRTCHGEGGEFWQESVPGMPMSDGCNDCTLQGKCARCGEIGLNDSGEEPCVHCGWNYDDAEPPGWDEPGHRQAAALVFSAYLLTSAKHDAIVTAMEQPNKTATLTLPPPRFRRRVESRRVFLRIPEPEASQFEALAMSRGEGLATTCLELARLAFANLHSSKPEPKTLQSLNPPAR